MTNMLSDNGLLYAEDLYYMLGANPDIKMLDATYSVPGGQKSPFQAFLGRHINTAQFFDIDIVADQQAALPHTAPSAEYFAACVSALGISNDDHVVIYDQSGAYMASSRAWWMFRLFGHENVYVLQGGLQAWVAKGFPVVEGAPDIPEPTNFRASLRQDLIVGRNNLMNNLETQEMVVLDARAPGRFNGDEAEPRPGMRPGHIPRSYNLPYSDVLEDMSPNFRSDEALEKTFSALNVSKDTAVAITCGSGVTACTVALALFKARGQTAAIYDGSWSEWGDEAAGTPVEISA